MKVLIYILIPILILLASFQLERQNAKTENLCITLKWFKAYPSQDFRIVKTGMQWSLSYLGAMLPKNSLDSAMRFKDSCTFSLDLTKLGFNENALNALSVVCDSIKQSEDFRRNGFIDISRFLVLTLYSPYHYYQITQAIPTLSEFVKKYKFDEPEFFGVTNSTVSKGHRLIKFSKDTSLFSIGFIAEEGDGSLIDNSFIPEVYEVFDLMPNGQFRYAIYNHEGKLIDVSTDKFSQAGAIGKCMWCHETYFQPLYTKNIAVSNMMDNATFENRIACMQKKLDAYRQTLNGDIDFNNRQDHTQSELLYISFMEPSFFRLKYEFGNDSLALKKISELESHIYDEFPFLGNLYSRKIIDKYFSYRKIRVPDFVREKSNFEPNYFK